jgi:predicted GNAT family acetyltransferase
MVPSAEPVTVRHAPERHRFETEIDGEIALLQYRLSDDIITFTHTEVPPAFEGRGIGGQLAHAGLEFAKAEGLKVVVRCSFVGGYIDHHPEYQGLLAAKAPPSV